MDDSWIWPSNLLLFLLISLWVLGFLEINGPKSKLRFKLYIEQTILHLSLLMLLLLFWMHCFPLHVNICHWLKKFITKNEQNEFQYSEN
jgi:hypothetical protein